MGRKPLPAAVRKRQLNVALDGGTRGLLEESAKLSQISVADEIRHRLERTFEQDKLVREMALKKGQSVEDLILDRLKQMLRQEENFGLGTIELGQAVMELAHDVRFSDTVGWVDHSKVYAALVEAIDTWLNAIKPSSEDDDKEVTELMEKEDYNAQATGKTIAQLRLRNRGFGSPQARQKRLQSYKVFDEHKAQARKEVEK